VYVYRVETLTDIVRHNVTLYDNSEEIGEIQYGSYISYYISPGKHTLQGVYKRDKDNYLDVDLSAGCVYFFHLQVKSFPFEINVFEQVSPEFAENKMSKMTDMNVPLRSYSTDGVRYLNPSFLGPNESESRENEVLSDSYTGVSARLEIESGASLAVVNLQPQGVDTSTASIVTDILSTEIANTGHFTLIERSQMNQIVNEQMTQQSGITLSDCSEASCAVELGKLLNVQYLLVGTIGKLGEKIIISIRLVDVETGEIRYSERITSPNMEMIDINISKFAANLR